MLALTILSVFVFLIALLVFMEYRNEKKYQEERRRHREQSTPRTTPTPTQTPVKPEPRQETSPAPKPEIKPEIKPEPMVITKKLPEGKYPQFTHVRLLEMGLSDEEAKEFVAELIPQIETQIPLIAQAMQELDFHKMERLTHSIKGSATNLGTGGVSDLLVEYNTYLKTGDDIDIAKAYFAHLGHYNDALKKQYA